MEKTHSNDNAFPIVLSGEEYAYGLTKLEDMATQIMAA